MLCKEEYEKYFPEDKRTKENLHVWKVAWNQALNQISNQIANLYLF